MLYEGYLLYPYRASAAKNRLAGSSGCWCPGCGSDERPREPWSTQTECLLEPEDTTTVRVLVRFLHVQSKTVESVDVEAGTFNEVLALPVDGSELVPWDEATEQEVTVEVPLARLLAGELTTPFERPGGRRVEPVHTVAGKLAGRTVRRRWPVMGSVRLSAERLEGPYGLVRLRLQLENASAWNDPGADRSVALRHSLVAAHSLLGVDRGVFLSLLDPPEWAKPAAEACRNLHTWPVLIGEEGRRDAMLSSPIILYDHPTIAPESPGDLFDATEIDEILTLRTWPSPRREARGQGDRRAGGGDHRPGRQHAARAAGAPARRRPLPPRGRGRRPARSRRAGPTGCGPQPGGSRQRDRRPPSGAVVGPGGGPAVSPETDGVVVAGVTVAKGSRVRLRPGQRRADAQDMFLAGRLATVEAVFLDVDGDRHLAVTLDEDPAADLQRWHGRYLYFSPDEVEPR